MGPLAFLVVTLLGAAQVHAQAVHWEMGDSQLGRVVQLVFDDCEPSDDPQLPPTPSAVLAPAGRSSNFSMTNGSTSQSVTLTYIIQARSSAPLTIPAFSVKTNKGVLQVPAFDAGKPAMTPDSVAKSKLIPDRTTVWAGEVFGLTYRLTAARRNNPQINPTFDWSAAPLIAEDWSKPEVTETTVDGQRQLDVNYHTRIYGKAANTVKLQAATHLLQVQTGSVGFGFLVQPRMEPVSVASDQPVIEVRALPTPPAGFSGAVGQFKFSSKIVPKQAAVGEPITWTLELTGTGNWPDIEGLPSREVSKDFQVVQPKAKRTPTDGKLFDATLTEDVVLVPTKAGTYTLPGVKFVYFDPQVGAYQTVRTDSTDVTVTAPAAPSPSANAGTAGTEAHGTESTTGPAAARPPLASPAAPAGIPRDPLPGSDAVARPLSRSVVAVWLLVPFAGLGLFWLVLAARRAARTDPLRPQREAHARLALLLAEMRTTSDPKRRAAQLLQWQHDSAVLWQVRHAAPGASALPANAGEWTALWRESDRALYGANAALPSDWVARAEAALTAKRVPAFNPSRLFLPRNLLPFAAVVAVLLVLQSTSLRAAASSPEASYRSGDFAAAEKSWRETLAQHPTDWIARHNLALALAQQDRTGESAAEAAAAFVQHPDDPSVRWHLALTADKAGFIPAPLTPFLKEGPVAALAGFAGPAGWQRILIGAAFVIALSLGWLLFAAYSRGGPLQYWLASALCGTGILIGGLAIFGYASFGETADIRAVVVWRGGTLRSIPTEADTTQKTTVLSAGSIGIVDKTFFSWDRLAFSNGQTGWVRKEEVVPLWR